jgi:hypothetical protein
MPYKPKIRKRPVPESSLLAKYLQPDCYTDCYTVDVPHVVKQSDYIDTFYTTWLFKIERSILKYAVSRPSTDAQARQLAVAATDSFTAWTVEERNENELLLCDFQGRTRSWLKTAPPPGEESGTRLFFGSAVVSAEYRNSDQGTEMPGFGILLAFHKLYSRALLRAARSKLDTRCRQAQAE